MKWKHRHAKGQKPDRWFPLHLSSSFFFLSLFLSDAVPSMLQWFFLVHSEHARKGLPSGRCILNPELVLLAWLCGGRWRGWGSPSPSLWGQPGTRRGLNHCCPFYCSSRGRRLRPTGPSPRHFSGLPWTQDWVPPPCIYRNVQSKRRSKRFLIQAPSRGCRCCLLLPGADVPPLGNTLTGLGGATAEQKTIAQTSNPVCFPWDGKSSHGRGREVQLRGGRFLRVSRTFLPPRPPPDELS